jgi:hypothetical protein
MGDETTFPWKLESSDALVYVTKGDVTSFPWKMEYMFHLSSIKQGEEHHVF